MRIPKVFKPYEQHSYGKRLVSFLAVSGALFVICYALMAVLSVLSGCLPNTP